MRYAIFTDVHANLEALEAVLAKIDDIAQEEPIDQIWFLGDLVGYGPNPNECIDKLRSRTDVIIAGNHDWAVVGKINLEDFSEAARISAEWTAKQLTKEHREFLIHIPERIEREDCVLVHGSPYGPLWEYLTSEVLAERSFEYFSTRYCFVGHTHIPAIFQQPNGAICPEDLCEDDQITEKIPVEGNSEDEDTMESTNLRATQQNNQRGESQEQAHIEQESLQAAVVDAADALAEAQHMQADDVPDSAVLEAAEKETESSEADATTTNNAPDAEQFSALEESPVPEDNEERPVATHITAEEDIRSAEDRLNEEIEELLALLGISQSMINASNEMIIPPEGRWQAPDNYRAIINPGGVGQPRDGNPRAAFMIYDTERGFTFYRVPYNFEKTQEKIIKAGLPPYLATRLAYGC